MTTPPDWSVEKASPDLAAPLAKFAARAFRDAFGALNDPADVGGYCARAFKPAVQQRELVDPAMTTFVAMQEGELIGYAQLQDEHSPGADDESPGILLKRIYVDQKWLGAGVAQALMRAAAGEASARGARTLWLTVWERNPRGIRFYSRLGMRVIGEADFLLGSEMQRDLVMSIPVGHLQGALSHPREDRPAV